MNKDLSSSIKKIAWAYILLLFDFNLGLNGNSINIFPNWLGYCLIYHTFITLSKYEESVLLLKSLHLILFLYDLVIWILALIGIVFDIYVVGVIFTIINVYFNFQLITNIATISQTHGYPKSETLLTLRGLSVIVLTLANLPTPWFVSSPLIWKFPLELDLMSIFVLVYILISMGIQFYMIYKLFDYASYEVKREVKALVEQL